MGSPLQSEPTLSVPREIGRGTILDRWRLPDGTLYLDNAATRPMLPEVAEEMARLMANNPLNASSKHKYGQKAARMLEDARNFFKSELNVPSTGELIFNSGATEGLNMLLKSAYFADPTKNHIVTVKTEHKAVLNTCAYLETIGAEVTYLDVDEWGQITVSDVEAAIRPTTCAVCVMWVNNETGLKTDVAVISEHCHRHGVRFICDLTQGVAKHDIDLSHVGISGGVYSAHKFGGPVGIGVVVFDPSAFPRNHDGYRGMGNSGREGTVSVYNVCGAVRGWECFQRAHQDELVTACEELEGVLGLRWEQKKWPDKIEWSRYVGVFSGLSLNQFSPGVAYSFGSACSSGLESGSHVYSNTFGGVDFVRLSF